MGSQIAAKNRELMEEHHITHILAIGWNLQKHFEDDFEYLLLNRVEDRPSFIILKFFKQCFDFMDNCFLKRGRLLVHCHKGLSRSATVVIAYVMYKHHESFADVLNQVRKNRPFVMPNIGFQVQLRQFEKQKYSLDIEKDYKDFNVIGEIESHMIEEIRDKITYYYDCYLESKYQLIDDKDLFSQTMLTHQLFKLQKQGKLNETDVKIITESIDLLRKIQVDFVQNETSIKRFDIMFEIN